jgi:hypothetical protein
MTTEKTDGADNSATEGAQDLDGLRKELETNLSATVTDGGETETAEAKAERARDEAGRFTRAQEKAEAKADGKAEEVDQWAQPPSALRPEYKAEWAKLDKKWREEIHRRESDFHKGIEPYKTGHSAYERLQKEVLSPYMSRIQASGMEPERFVAEFLQLDHVLAYGTPQQKQQALAAVASHYKLDLSQYAQPAQAQTQVNPELQRVQQELAELRGTLTQSQTAAQQREQQEALSQIGAFRADPKNIYFDDVREHMAALLNSGKAKDMADAYEQACWANPNVRTALLKQQRETEEKQRIEEAKRKTTDAKRAGFDVQAQGAAQTGSRPLSLEQELAQRAGVQLST